MNPIPKSRHSNLSRLAALSAIPSVALLAIAVAWTAWTDGRQQVVAQDAVRDNRSAPLSPRLPTFPGGDASDRLGRPGPSGDQRRISNEPRVIHRPVTETDPATGKTHTRYVVEKQYDDPFGRGGTRRAVPLSRAERSAIEWAERFSRTQDVEEREQIRDRLRDSLSEAFDETRERQRGEIEELERQLDSLRRLDAERQERKDDIVRRRMKQLLGEPDVLDWDFPSRQDLAFPFEGPRLPETSPRQSSGGPGGPGGPGRPPRMGSPTRPGQPSPRSEAGRPAPGPLDDPFGEPPSSAPKTEEARAGGRRPSLDRRPSGEDETKPERPRSRGTLRAENIDIELTDRPRDESYGTSIVRSTSAERILDLIETIARKKAVNRKYLASTRRIQGDAAAERMLKSQRAEMEGYEARLRLARVEWEAVGRQLEEDVRFALSNLRHVTEQLKKAEKLFANGSLTPSELAAQKAELARAEADYVSAEGSYGAWRKMDEILRQRTAALAAQSDETKDASDRQGKAFENTPRIVDEVDDRDADEQTPEPRTPQDRDDTADREAPPNDAPKPDQQPEREIAGGDADTTDDGPDTDAVRDTENTEDTERKDQEPRDQDQQPRDQDREARNGDGDESADTDP